MRWNALTTHAFSAETKELLLNKLHNKLTNAGDLIIRSEESREQEINKKRCFEKFEQILASALYVPKRRKKTKPTKAAKEKRLKTKKNRSEIKKMRNKRIL